jgi:Raf kinase inhibitor-like YbhB/YbcL family protein
MFQKTTSLMISTIILTLVFFSTAFCGSKDRATTSEGRGAMALKISSSAFTEGQMIPARNTCDGEDISPPLKWDSVPEGTKRLALICDDPDAPVGTWVHWVLYNLPSSVTELSEKVPTDEAIPNGARQGLNDFGRIGYGGPCPPRGSTHRYFFRLYALNTELTLKPRATKKDLTEAMKGHILGEGQLMGIYRRK